MFSWMCPGKNIGKVGKERETGNKIGETDLTF